MKLKVISDTTKLYFNGKTQRIPFPWKWNRKFSRRKTETPRGNSKSLTWINIQTISTDYRKAKKHCAFQLWTEKLFLSHAFLHHLILRCSMAYNYLHLSQLLRKTGPSHFLSLQSWRAHSQASDGFSILFFPSFLLTIGPRWFWRKRHHVLSQRRWSGWWVSH